MILAILDEVWCIICRTGSGDKSTTGIRHHRIHKASTACIHPVYRIIPAVRKHIEPQEALAGAAVGIGVEEALHGGVIISALQVIEARLFGWLLADEAKKGGLERHLKPPPKRKITKTGRQVERFSRPPREGNRPPGCVVLCWFRQRQNSNNSPHFRQGTVACPQRVRFFAGGLTFCSCRK